MKKIILALTALPLLLGAANIVLVGDSTMTNYPAKRAPLTGWGMKLPALCKDGVKVRNVARSGASAKSYREKLWAKAIAQVKKGDFVFIQFGHNDRSKKNDRYSDPNSDYQDYLRGFIAEVKAKGATPVLLTATPVCRFNKANKMVNSGTHHKYNEATRKVAKECGVELIDHNKLLLAEFGPLGKEKAEKYYMNLAPGEFPAYPKGKKDNTHLRDTGAEVAAKLAVKNAKAQKLKVAELFK